MSALRVLKVGGSLIDGLLREPLLQRWLAQQPSVPTIIITGGGPWADQVRQLDVMHGLSCQVAHRLAIRAMSLTSWLLAASTPQWLHLMDWSELVRRCDSGAMRKHPVDFIFDAADFMERVERHLTGTKLPVGWDVTSDSIAARIASLLRADELWLLKSRLPKSNVIDLAAKEGYVDNFFPVVAADLATVTAIDFHANRRVHLSKKQ